MLGIPEDYDCDGDYRIGSPPFWLAVKIIVIVSFIISIITMAAC